MNDILQKDNRKQIELATRPVTHVWKCLEDQIGSLWVGVTVSLCFEYPSSCHRGATHPITDKDDNVFGSVFITPQ